MLWKSLFYLADWKVLALEILEKTDHIDQKITLTITTLSRLWQELTKIFIFVFSSFSGNPSGGSSNIGLQNLEDLQKYKNKTQGNENESPSNKNVRLKMANKYRSMDQHDTLVISGQHSTSFHHELLRRNANQRPIDDTDSLQSYYCNKQSDANETTRL